MVERVLVLVDRSGTPAVDKLERVLAFFGVASRRITVPELLTLGGESGERARFRILGTSTAILELTDVLEEASRAGAEWPVAIHSAFVYPAGNLASLESLARRITGDRKASLVHDPAAEWIVSDQFPELCGSMSGIRACVVLEGSAPALDFDATNTSATRIIFGNTGVAFVRCEFRGVPIFLSTADVIDVAAELPGPNFDVRAHFLAAVPVVLYIKWACANSCWQPSLIGACLVVDDPLLTPRYGQLDFQRLLDLMQRAGFSTSIGFIPWNWNRCAPKTVELFRENPERYSLCIHGCDHTGGEFGSVNGSRLAWKSGQATQRMEKLHARTGLSHDPVMVFPQGVFSGTAMAVLKRGEFVGVVNTEVISTDPSAPPIRIADCWDVAVMNYGDFPIFTRRYPVQGLENFAFDILLGKPCLVVAHHNDFREDSREIVEFIERLNHLNARLVWTSLAEVVRSSFRQRQTSPGVVEIEMYAKEARIDNVSDERKRLRVRKRELAPATIEEIRVAARPVIWEARDNHVVFEVDVNPGESVTITIKFNEWDESGIAEENSWYRAKTMARRYLSEVRDNYLTGKAPSRH